MENNTKGAGDDYPIIPQSEKEPKKYPDFPQWLETEDGKKCLAWPISETKHLQNRLFWAFDAGRNCVWHQYLEQKKELTSLKEVVKELIHMAESCDDIGYLNVSEVHYPEEVRKARRLQEIIDRAKRISDNKVNLDV